MTALKSEALWKYVGEVFVRLAGTNGAKERLASIRGLSANIDNTNIVDILADDTDSVLKILNRAANYTFNYLENVDRDIILLLFWGTATNIAGTPTPITNEDLGTGWTLSNPIKLANKNGDNTIIDLTAAGAIKADATNLVRGTDFIDYVGDGLNGEKGATYIVPLTAQTWAITANYTYTPNSAETVELELSDVELKSFEVEIVSKHPEDETKQRVLTLSSAVLNTTYAMEFLNVAQAGDITGASMTFESNRGSKFIFHDEFMGLG